MKLIFSNLCSSLNPSVLETIVLCPMMGLVSLGGHYNGPNTSTDHSHKISFQINRNCPPATSLLYLVTPISEQDTICSNLRLNQLDVSPMTRSKTWDQTVTKTFLDERKAGIEKMVFIPQNHRHEGANFVKKPHRFSLPVLEFRLGYFSSL